jgi:hypothetical protein
MLRVFENTLLRSVRSCIVPDVDAPGGSAAEDRRHKLMKIKHASLPIATLCPLIRMLRVLSCVQAGELPCDDLLDFGDERAPSAHQRHTSQSPDYADPVKIRLVSIRVQALAWGGTHR